MPEACSWQTPTKGGSTDVQKLIRTQEHMTQLRQRLSFCLGRCEFLCLIALLEFFQEGRARRDFVRCRFAREGDLEGRLDLLIPALTGGGYSVGEIARLLQHDRVVEQRQRLQRHGGMNPPRAVCGHYRL